MGLFLPVSLPVTHSTAFPRGTQVCAFSFLCRHRPSGTYPKILHFLLHYLHSCLPCLFYTEAAEVSPVLAYNPLLILLFFLFLCEIICLSFCIRKFQKVSVCILSIQEVPHYLFSSLSSKSCYILSYQFSSPVSGAGLCQRQQNYINHGWFLNEAIPCFFWTIFFYYLWEPTFFFSSGGAPIWWVQSYW